MDEQQSLEHTAKLLGRKEEKERIIKLLEELAYTDADGHQMVGEFKTDLIALIKEKK